MRIFLTNDYNLKALLAGFLSCDYTYMYLTKSMFVSKLIYEQIVIIQKHLQAGHRKYLWKIDLFNFSEFKTVVFV